MAPAFEHVDKADLPVIEDNGAKARVVMGSLWGRQAPTTTYAATIYADIVLADGGAIPIDAAADERAIYVAEGAAALAGLPLDPMTPYALRPGVAATLRSDRGARVMLCGGAAFPTPRPLRRHFRAASR